MRITKDKNRLSGFKKFLLIYVCVFAAVVLAGLSVFYVYIAQYEQSRKDTVAGKFIESADEEYWKNIITGSYDIKTGEYETADSVLRECYLGKITGNALSFKKDYTQNEGTDTVYDIYSGDCKVALLSLDDSGERTFFGFTKWNTENVSLVPEAFSEFDPQDYTIEVPVGAEASVNGVMLDKSAGEVIAYSAITPFETALSDKYQSVRYVIKGLHDDPETTASLDGKALECRKEERIYSYRYPADSLRSLNLTVPCEAVVKINGIALGDEYKIRSGISYSNMNEFDKAAKNQHTLCEYSVDGLLDTPRVSVTFNGAEISGSDGVYSLSDTEKHTLVINAPEGYSVKVNGVTPGNEYISSSDDKYSTLSGFEGYLTAVPTKDTYTLNGLYNLPEVEVTDSDGRSAIREPGETGSYTYTFMPAASDAAKSEYEAMVKEFAEKYIYYTSQGYSNIDANNAVVLSYMIHGTDAYSRVANSTIGLKWNSPFTSVEYNSFVTDNYIQFSSECFTCEVRTDITMKMTGLVKNYKSHMKLLYIRTADGWKVGDMQVLG